MTVGKDNKVHLNKEKPVCCVRPSADVLFKSAAEIYGKNLLSVVLTGMGKDGADGTIYVKNNKGITLSQDEKTSVIYGMPKATYETGKVDEVIPLDNIAERICEIVKNKR